jgi:hypothetical protein
MRLVYGDAVVGALGLAFRESVLSPLGLLWLEHPKRSRQQ